MAPDAPVIPMIKRRGALSGRITEIYLHHSATARLLHHSHAAHRPTGHPPLRKIEDCIHTDAHHAHDDESREHEWDVEARTGDQHDVAYAGITRDDLRDHRADECEGDGDLQRCKEERQRTRDA